MKHRLSYASVTATLALLLAVGGTSAVGAQALLTGRNVKDDSLTGADIRNDSLTGADIRDGSLGSNLLSTVARANLRGQTGATGPKGEAGETGPQGPAGKGVASTIVTGDDVTDYHNDAPLATARLEGPGDYVIMASVDAHNTGADSSIGCALAIDNGIVGGGGGVNVAADATGTTTAASAVSVAESKDLVLFCEGGSTFDISKVSLHVHRLS